MLRGPTALTFALALSFTPGLRAEPAPAPAQRQVIPAAADIAGLDGSRWRTDLVLYNPGGNPATVEIELVPAAGGPTGAPLTVTVEAGGTAVVSSDDLAAAYPGFGSGALVVTTVVAPDGAPAPKVVATSRTWTAVTGGDGTFGQGISAVPWGRDGDLTASQRRLAGLSAGDDVRVNIGITNLSADLEQTFEVEAVDADGQPAAALTVVVAPRTWSQTNRVLERMGLTGDGFTVVVRRVGERRTAPAPDDGSSEPDYVAYASIVDRRTNDPTYRTGQAPVEGWGRPRFKILPAAARTDGADGSTWTTDLAVHYPGDQPIAILQMEMIPSDPAGGGATAPDRAVARLSPGGTVAIGDILGSSFPGTELAALQVKVTSGGSRFEDVQVVSRTWTPDPQGIGTMGQGIPALAYHEGVETLVVTGLRRSDRFRSNLGLVNASANVRLEVEVVLRDAAGQELGSFQETLEPWSHRQFNDVLGHVGVVSTDDTVATAVIEVQSQENLLLRPDEAWAAVLAAYGSVIDRVTNDPTTLHAVRMTVDAGDADAGGWVDFEARAPWYQCRTEEPPDEAVVVRAFDHAWHAFGGGDNTRTIVEEAVFPDQGEWNQIGLRLELQCPESGLCDHWDRTGSLGLILNPDDPEDEWRSVEVMRHITPYRVGMCQEVDVTALKPLLRGRRTLSSWIDTWVGPGHAQGEGWRISWEFVFYPGEPRGAAEVVPVWGLRSLEVGNTDPDRTVDAQTDPVTVTVPADVTRVEARLITTGHAFGNTDNCAEFCPLRQDLLVNGERRSVLPWRTDCEYNPVGGQQGTWRFDRNGWCPGAIVPGNTIDLTSLVGPSGELTVDLDVRRMDGDEFVNTTTSGTAPFEWISLHLLYYR